MSAYHRRSQVPVVVGQEGVVEHHALHPVCKPPTLEHRLTGSTKALDETIKKNKGTGKRLGKEQRKVQPINDYSQQASINVGIPSIIQ